MSHDYICIYIYILEVILCVCVYIYIYIHIYTQANMYISPCMYTHTSDILMYIYVYQVYN